MRKGNRRLFLMILYILTMLPNLVFANPDEGKFFYNKHFLPKVQEQYNLPNKIKTPNIDFQMTYKDKSGKQASIKPLPTDFGDALHKGYEAYQGLTNQVDLPLKSKITIKDLSTSNYKGKRIVLRDWQIYYSKDGKFTPGTVVQVKNIVTKSGTVQIDTGKEKGYYAVFLNVADNFKPGKGANFENWGSKGNWRSVGNKKVSGVKIDDWWFQGLRFSVGMEGGQPDMGLKELTFINDNGRETDPKKLKEDTPYTVKIIGRGKNQEKCVEKPQFISNLQGDKSDFIGDKPFCEEDTLYKVPEKLIPDPDKPKEVCVEINQIHTQRGENIKNKNDKICKEIGIDSKIPKENDMAIANILIPPTDTIEKGNWYRPVITVKNNNKSGKIVKNTKIHVEITDENGNDLFRNDITTNKDLPPTETVDIAVPRDIPVSTRAIYICATIHDSHTQKGENITNANDTMCKEYRTEFDANKNYSIKSFKSTPSSLLVGPTTNGTSTPTTFAFEIVNDSSDRDPLPSNPFVVIRKGSNVIWSDYVSVPIGETIKHEVTLNLFHYLGNQDYNVEVNPYRNVLEFVQGVYNPYADNTKSLNISTKQSTYCKDCLPPQTQSYWVEKIYESSYEGTPGIWGGYTYCFDSRRYDLTEFADFREKYEIEKIYFRSKVTKDNDHSGNQGWVDVTNGQPGKVKAGYGFELRVVTKYSTNRNRQRTASPPRDMCNFSRVSPSGPTAVDSPNTISVTTNLRTGDYLLNNEYCTKLELLRTGGPWYSRTKEFQLPTRQSLDGKTVNNKIYTSEKAKPGIYTWNITTDDFLGYQPSDPNVQKVDTSFYQNTISTLHDCKTLNIQVLPQDDLKTHIVQ